MKGRVPTRGRKRRNQMQREFSRFHPRRDSQIVMMEISPARENIDTQYALTTVALGRQEDADVGRTQILKLWVSTILCHR
ncbi:hypothetical protein GOBAR_AA30299 [Gossypium barbadense]|uniref:Uncharacterized protein n=1 Tax=Gossypium barbadense TaxID=3634 RepID=A0A2P5WH16_GOSBA|nr:hypothetical protein GOBAR_AA30299 [Gossypium barbadense]